MRNPAFHLQLAGAEVITRPRWRSRSISAARPNPFEFDQWQCSSRSAQSCQTVPPGTAGRPNRHELQLNWRCNLLVISGAIGLPVRPSVRPIERAIMGPRAGDRASYRDRRGSRRGNRDGGGDRHWWVDLAAALTFVTVTLWTSPAGGPSSEFHPSFQQEPDPFCHPKDPPPLPRRPDDKKKQGICRCFERGTPDNPGWPGFKYGKCSSSIRSATSFASLSQ